MGCPDTFEFRRTELAELSGRSTEDVTDQEVADNFYFEATDPNGVYRRYLEAAQLCAQQIFRFLTHRLSIWQYDYYTWSHYRSWVLVFAGKRQSR